MERGDRPGAGHGRPGGSRKAAAAPVRRERCAGPRAARGDRSSLPAADVRRPYAACLADGLVVNAVTLPTAPALAPLAARDRREIEEAVTIGRAEVLPERQRGWFRGGPAGPRVRSEVDPRRPGRVRAWRRGRAIPSCIPHVLRGAGVARLFEKPSARTRVSTGLAVSRWWSPGLHAGRGSRHRQPGAGRGRRGHARVGYCALSRRASSATDVLERIAAAVDVPVVNLLSDRAHPCQALADLLTLRELFGPIEGRRSRSWVTATTSPRPWRSPRRCRGVEPRRIAARLRARREIVDRVCNLGGSVELVCDPYEAVTGRDAVYTDVWTSMGDEHEGETCDAAAAFARLPGRRRLMAAAGQDVCFLHCLPAHRGEEVTAEVLEGRRSRSGSRPRTDCTRPAGAVRSSSWPGSR